VEAAVDALENVGDQEHDLPVGGAASPGIDLIDETAEARTTGFDIQRRELPKRLSFKGGIELDPFEEWGDSWRRHESEGRHPKLLL